MSIRLDGGYVILALFDGERRADATMNLSWYFFGGLVLRIADLLIEEGLTIRLPEPDDATRLAGRP